MRRAISTALGFAIAAVYCGGASAHHSAAMFDDSKNLALTGVVKSFEYTQPHCWLTLVVDEASRKGGPAEWRIELGAPTLLMMMNIRRSSFPVGDKFTITIHPLRDGRPEGEYVRAVTADGKPVGRPMGPPPDAAGGPPRGAPPGAGTGGATPPAGRTP